MAIATGTALALGGAAVLGGAAGAIPKTQKQSASLVGPSRIEAQTFDGASSDYMTMRSLVDAGPGQSDVATGTQSQRDYAAMLQKYSDGGYMPNDGDIASSNTLAQSLFNPQRVQMQQSFMDQSVEANRRAALMGRTMNDPILAAKMAQEQTRQSSMLNANQGAWSTQYAMQQPGMRLGYAADRTNVLSGLASQAMSNRQALLGLGSNLMQNERAWRYQTSDKTGESGGGLNGAMSGGLAGAGMGLSAVSGGSLFGGGNSNMGVPGQINAYGGAQNAQGIPLMQGPQRGPTPQWYGR